MRPASRWTKDGRGSGTCREDEDPDRREESGRDEERAERRAIEHVDDAVDDPARDEDDRETRGPLRVGMREVSDDDRRGEVRQRFEAVRVGAWRPKPLTNVRRRAEREQLSAS